MRPAVLGVRRRSRELNEEQISGSRDRSEFGSRLVQARQKAGLSQPQLAAKVGMSQGTLGEAETKAHASIYTAQLASACGVRPMWLATGEGPMNDLPFSPQLQAALAAASPELQRTSENVLRVMLGLPPLGR